MKKILSASRGGISSAALRRMSLSLLLVAGLAGGLWVVTLPAARARNATAIDMVQGGLPPGKTMKNATKPEYLASVCAAAKEHRDIAAEIARTAVFARRDLAGDVVATVLRCSPNVDCNFVATIVASAVRAAPSEASVIDDAALAMQPDCADAIQGSTNLDTGGKESLDGKQVMDGKEILDNKDVPAEGPERFGGGAPTFAVPLPGSVGGGGGGFDPGDRLIMVCDNGTQRTVRASRTAGSPTSHNGTISVPESELADFLSSHPGSFVGTCQPTPTTNQ